MTTTTTTTTPKRADANRRNARKSTGPRTPEGKERSRFNAIKHGMTARTLVLPGEDAGAFQDRLDAWASELQPCNDVEQVLVERSATVSWQLERADRADAARLASIIVATPAEEALRHEEEAAALGRRLFHDRCGPVPLYPHSLYDLQDQPRVSASRLGDDPDDPPRLLLQLESTAAGCRWLLDRWGELGALLDRGLSWQSPDKLKAIRLLGRQPLDAADSEVVALIFQACHVLDPQPAHASGAERSQSQGLAEAVRVLDVMGKGAFSLLRDVGQAQAVGPLESDPEADENFDDLAELSESEDDVEFEARIEWQRCGAAFAELRGELTEAEGRGYRRRLEGRRVDELRPRDPAEARAKLRGIVEQAVARLEARREVHEQWEAVAAANQVARLSFDASPEGERLRRFQLAGNRSLLRTLDTLLKFRRDGDGPQPDPDVTDGSHSPTEGEHPGEPTRPAQADDPADTAQRSARVSDPAETADRRSPVELPDAPCSNPARTEPHPPGPTLNPARSQEGGPPGEPLILPGIEPRRPAAIDLPISQNEPTTDPVRDIPTETAPADDRRDSQNEPTAPADDHADPQVQPSAASDDRPNSQNEPTIAGAGGHSSGETSTRERVDALEEVGSRSPGPREETGTGPPSQEPSRRSSRRAKDHDAYEDARRRGPRGSARHREVIVS